MKILHCCLSCFYIDGYNYQENVLPRQNKLDGHDVLIVASTETFIDNKQLGYIEPKEYFNEDGILVKRIPYRYFPSKIIQHKIRVYQGLMQILTEFKPDIVFFHGLCAFDIMTLAKYKQLHPDVMFYADSHEDYNNSARGFLSKNILHKIIYKYFLRKSLAYIDKIFYISYETLIFTIEMYKIPEDLLEFYPLGGIIYREQDRFIKRCSIREKYSIKDDDVLLVHSGKMDIQKRTLDLIKAFHNVKSKRLKLLIIGSVSDDIREEFLRLIAQDTRIQFLGWKTGDELMNCLCACDLYVQPGSQSATMQNALCCGSAAALYPHESHKYLLNDAVFYLETQKDMEELFTAIANDREVLEEKRKLSQALAANKLDYKKLAARLYF